MTKVSYPFAGLLSSTTPYFTKTNQHLTNAINNCSFDVPSGFSYAGFVNGLSGEISDFAKEIKDIKAKTKVTDVMYDNLENKLVESTKVLPSNILEPRDRLIK
jgi:hypothetical protein